MSTAVTAPAASQIDVNFDAVLSEPEVGNERLLSVGVAAVSLFAVGLNLPIRSGATTATLAVLVLAPVWVFALSRFRWTGRLYSLVLIALASGLLTPLFVTERSSNTKLATELLILFLTGFGAVGLILWARTLMPTATVALWFGAGYLCDAILSIPGSANIWKFQLSVPITILLLACASVTRRATPTVVVLGIVAVISIAMDSRSFSGFCVLSAVLVMWQARPANASRRASRASALLALLVGGVALYVAASSVLTSGYLGQEVQERTQQQINQSGSLLVGGRPEWAGTIQLMIRQPQGFGLGTLPNEGDINAAKAGMSAIGTDVNNGYVDHYMFGDHIKLHSVIADLWASFGIGGLLLGIFLLGLVIVCLVDRIRHRQASGLLCLFGLLAAWDLLFGPIHKNLIDVVFAVGLLLPAASVVSRVTRSHTQAAGQRTTAGQWTR